MPIPLVEDSKISFNFKDMESALKYGKLIAIIFLLIGFGFIYLTWYFANKENVIHYNPEHQLIIEHEEMKKVSMLGLFALCFTLFPLFMLFRTSRDKSKTSYPESFIFDLFKEEFIVKEQDSSISSFSFSEISDFGERKYTVKYGSKHPKYITYYVACMKKKDGAIWDLCSSENKEEIDSIIQKLNEKINVNSKNTVMPADELPPSISVTENENSIHLRWKIDSNIFGILFFYIILFSFFGVIYYATDNVIVLIFAIVFTAVFSYIIFSFGKSDKEMNKPFCYIDISQNNLEYGVTDKSGKNKKQIKKIDINDITKIKFDYDEEIENVYKNDRELIIYSKRAKKDLENLKSNSINAEEIKKVSKDKNKALKLRISNLRVSDIMKFEIFLENKIKKFGGNPL